VDVSRRSGHADRHGWDERYGKSERTFPLEPNRLVAAEVDGLGPGTALDIATGEGRHAVWLASLGWHVVAVDFSPVGVRRAQARARAEDGGPGNIAFAVADVHRLRLPPARFDLVLASFFHPRPPERAALYRAMASTLIPGGTLLLVSYDKANLTQGSGGPQDPELLIDPPAFAAELEGFGLSVVRADTVPLRVAGPDGTDIHVVDAIIRAVRPS
jgi:SAM-dependent methyltransferase